MIHYQLRCGCGHEFDGWFGDSGGFERQARAGLIACPCCGGVSVTRALMAPGLARKSRAVPPAETGPVPAPVAASMAAPVAVPGPARGRIHMPAKRAAGVMPDAVRAALSRLRTEVESRCDYVGSDFAAEARRIHDGDAPARGIYGESTLAQAEALAEDGIEIARIPWVPRADS